MYTTAWSTSVQITARCPAGEDAAEHEHGAGRPLGGEPEILPQQLVDADHVAPVERGQEEDRDDQHRDEPAEIGREVGQIAPVGLLGAPDERGCRLGGGQHRNSDRPDGHRPCRQEELAAPRGAAPEPQAQNDNDRQVRAEHDPIERMERRGGGDTQRRSL
jgi:hypothetical protein